MRTFFRRFRRPQDRPFLHVERCEDDRPPAPPLALKDWPEIESRHPSWWQVHRIEVTAGQSERRAVLIAETRTEDEAFRVAAQQFSQVRITKWGAKLKPYYSMREPLIRFTGTVIRAD